jgi:hypothetical protein
VGRRADWLRRARSDAPYRMHSVRGPDAQGRTVLPACLGNEDKFCAVRNNFEMLIFNNARLEFHGLN